jgi:two-component system response regulator RegA
MVGCGVVLLVDDDELWLRACERGFRGLADTVRSATNVSDALTLADEHPPPDLMIADVRLGTESGIDLIEPVRRAYPACKIVMVSAYLSVALTARIVRKGAHLVLFKPVHPTEILHQLQDTDEVDEPWVTPTLARAEWEHISRVLLDCNGNVSEAARRLGILRQSLQRRLRKHAPSQ